MSRVTINVNGLSLVHEDSGGVSNATLPDVCYTPSSGAPVPFPNVARSRDLASGSSLVRADRGHRIALAGSRFDRSRGDEPGEGGGVTSGVHEKEATFLSHSFDVLIEGRGACRLGDKMLHNRGNTINCHGVLQAIAPEGLALAEDVNGKEIAIDQKPGVPLWEAPTLPTRNGVDTNCRTLNTSYAKNERKMSFVCRYISGFSEEEATAQGVAITPNNIRLSLEEAQQLGMDLVAIWEVSSTTSNIGPNERAIEAGTLDAQYALGYQDGMQADQNLNEAGGGGHPIYFTVDFEVTDSVWNEKLWDPVANLWITKGHLIKKYFEGINDAVGVPRTGVYGRYTAVKKLFEAKMVRYGWQMTFNHKPYPKAQLQQISIFPDLTRWGPKLPKTLLRAIKDPDYAATLTLSATQQQTLSDWWTAFSHGMATHWKTSGAGGLDFDRAVMADFGQWRPAAKAPSKPKK